MRCPGNPVLHWKEWDWIAQLSSDPCVVLASLMTECVFLGRALLCLSFFIYTVDITNYPLSCKVLLSLPGL